MDADGREGPVLTRIVAVAETGSTNADLQALARTGAEEGLWLRADRQTAGRGRQGRVWVSPAGNFYGSTLVRIRADDPAPASLALVAALAVEQTVAAFVGRTLLQLKWPNDLLLARAKVAGILLERVGDAVVVGIGVNLAHHPALADRSTTSLAEHGAAVPPEEFALRLAERFADRLARWRHGGLGPVIARWTERAHPPGTPLSVRLPDGTPLEGQFERMADDGALVLGLADGSARVIHAADVFLG